ncbi:class III lanthionine synthetase LanKC [Streptomyces sp. GESEQ-35]|uniref:class III lanthionine synthetase LanKC n=1 Tax=Streptomyces sp. GESEQ-35 TaxID=2812657 RepID=UPI001B319D0F|nr:class III lanthionine synthetase LanKC [Streptomyces sp. GESEQ-35]
MYLTYLQYCRPGSPFYEQRDIEGPESSFPLHRAQLPEGWTRAVRPEWIMYSRADRPLPWQGWKIHVSATAGNAERLLDRVSRYCFERRVPFKALAGPATLSRRNSKYADRGASGKFVTVYPPTDEALATTLRALDALIGGSEGPTILSDLRYHEGPLHVRYGAFVSRRITDESGRQTECIEDPDGKLVPDERRPGFHPPSWAELPEVLRESLRARDGRRLADFPYTVSRALHFSNGGGVYLAERQDSPGRKILLKEARPHCGLDESGRDAIARLETERAALTDLAGLPGVPAVDAHVDGVEHKFLGREYIEGRTLMDLALERNPFISHDGSLSPEAYAKWIAGLVGQVTRTVARMHERGWVFGDLHPGNIVVDEAERVHFIDFESASQDLAGYRQTMGVFGYRAPAEYQGRAVDRYALGCMRIGLLLPMTRLLSLGTERATDLCRAAAERFGVGDEYFAGVAEQLAPCGEVSGAGSASSCVAADVGAGAPSGPVPEVAPAGRRLARAPIPEPVSHGADGETRAGAGGPPSPPPVGRTTRLPAHAPATEPVAVPAPPAEDVFGVDRLADSLRAWRTPGREDRLYPGDVRQFLQPGGGLGLAYGAAGVLWALRRCGGEADPEDLDWLRRRVHATEDIPVGFHSGLAGIAYAVREWDPELAAYCRDRAVRSAESVQDLSLGSGLSGLGAHLLDTGELTAADRLAARLTDLLPPQQERIAAGLVDGAAGIAVFALRAAVALGNPEYRRLAERLLDLEATRFGFTSGASPVRAAFPAFGTGISTGALGLGLGLHDHVRLTGDDRFAEPLRRITTLAQHTTAAHNGLLNGRLGLVQLLLAVAPDEPASQIAVRRALEEAAWHTTPLGPHRIALGDEALKLSLDLGTGLAGLVVAAAAVREARCALPLWESPR